MKAIALAPNLKVAQDCTVLKIKKTNIIIT